MMRALSFSVMICDAILNLVFLKKSTATCGSVHVKLVFLISRRPEISRLLQNTKDSNHNLDECNHKHGNTGCGWIPSCSGLKQ